MGNKNNIVGIALVYTICPICGNKMDEQIIMNAKLTEYDAKKIEIMNGQCIGYDENACNTCKETIKDYDAVYMIGFDPNKSNNKYPFRTGQIVAVRADIPLIQDNLKFINETKNGVKYAYISEEQGLQFNIFKIEC